MCGRLAYPVNVEDIDVGRAELLERFFHGNMEGLHVVAYIARLLLDIIATTLEVGAILQEIQRA